jgi:hypothetical protein
MASPFSNTIRDLMFWENSTLYQDKIEKRLKVKLSPLQMSRIRLYGEKELEKVIADGIERIPKASS